MIDLEDLSDKRFTLYKSGLLVVTKINSRNREPGAVKSMVERNFKVKKSVVQSACIALWQNKTSEHCLFLTFTIPFDIDEKKLVKIWNSLLNNLRVSYKINNYVWVKEYQKNGRLHYHIIIDRVWVDIESLQETWNVCIKNVTGRMPKYRNSVRLGFNPIIRSVQRIKNYLSKYITKNEDGSLTCFKGRAYGYTSSFVVKREIEIFEFQNFFSEKYKVKLIANTKFYLLYVVFDYFDIC